MRVQRQKQQTVIQQRVVLTIIAVHDNSSKLFGLCLDKNESNELINSGIITINF